MGILVKKSTSSVILNFLGVPLGIINLLFLQTYILTEGQIGNLTLIVDKVFLLSPFILLGTLSIVPRFYFLFDKTEKEFNGFMSFILALPIISGIIVCYGIYLLDIKVFMTNFWIIIPILFFSIYIRIFEGYLTTKSLVNLPVFTKSILFRLFVITSLILYYFKFIDFNGLLICYIISFGLHFLIVLLYFLKNLSFKLNFNFNFLSNKNRKDVILFSLFSLLGASTSILLTKLDTVMIETILGDYKQVGIYVIAASIVALIEFPKRALSSLAMPIIAKQLGEQQQNDVEDIYKKSALNLLIIGLVFFNLIWFNLDVIFSIIPNGNKFVSGSLVILFLGLAKVVDMAFGINSEILTSSKYYKWNIFTIPVLAVISIGLNLLLIPQFLIVGSAVATLISVFIFNVIRSIIIKKKLQLAFLTPTYFKSLLILGIPFLMYLVPIDSVNNYLRILIADILILASIITIFVKAYSPDLNSLVRKALGFIKINI